MLLGVFCFTAILALLPPQATPAILQCDTLTVAPFYDTVEYLCDSSSTEIATKADATVTNVTGTNVNGQSFGEVSVVHIFDTRCSFFPKDLDKFFAGLVSIQIVNASLSEVHKEELRPFAKLQFLMLTNNLLETVERDLFEANRALRLLDLSHNRISIVDVTAFGALDLDFLYFYQNPCMDDAVADNRTEVKAFVVRLCCSCRLK